MPAINIYSVPQVANLTVEGVISGSNMITQSAYGRNTFKIFRNTDNDLDFLVRDIDRQPVVVTGNLVFRVWGNVGETIIDLPLTVFNAPRGHYRLTISSTVVNAIRAGVYTWGVTNEDGATVKLLYTNQDYGSKGIVEVMEGILLPADNPYVITPDMMTTLSQDLYSSALPAAMMVDNMTGNHTIAVYLDNFTGRLLIEASMDTQVPVDNTGWTPVNNIVWNNQSGTIPINFIGNFTYVKFTITNASGFTKLVYRS